MLQRRLWVCSKERKGKSIKTNISNSEDFEKTLSSSPPKKAKSVVISEKEEAFENKAEKIARKEEKKKKNEERFIPLFDVEEVEKRFKEKWQKRPVITGKTFLLEEI